MCSPNITTTAHLTLSPRSSPPAPMGNPPDERPLLHRSPEVADVEYCPVDDFTDRKPWYRRKAAFLWWVAFTVLCMVAVAGLVFWLSAPYRSKLVALMLKPHTCTHGAHQHISLFFLGVVESKQMKWSCSWSFARHPQESCPWHCVHDFRWYSLASSFSCTGETTTGRMAFF